MLGASMHSFKTPDSGLGSEDDHSKTVSRVWTGIGVVLCIAIFVYLSYVARRAVDEELDEDGSGAEEETIAFLSPRGRAEAEDDGHDRPMAESPFSMGLIARDEEARIGL